MDYIFRSGFRGRLISKTSCTTAKKNISLLSLLFFDGSGEIKGNVWRESVKVWNSKLTVGEVYDVSNFSVVKNDLKFTRLRPGRVQFNFHSATKVMVC